VELLRAAHLQRQHARQAVLFELGQRPPGDV
jgi:hypothetical protein